MKNFSAQSSYSFKNKLKSTGFKPMKGGIIFCPPPFVLKFPIKSIERMGEGGTQALNIFIL